MSKEVRATEDTRARDDVEVRGLAPEDEEAVIALDAKVVGRSREGYLRPKLREARAPGGIQVSLAAEVGGSLAGFLLAKVWYGEFGELDPVAVLDTIGVRSEYRGHGVGAALLDQLRRNLAALHIHCLRTEVSWRNPELLTFFHHEGFEPAARLVLETDPASRAARERRERRMEPGT